MSCVVVIVGSALVAFSLVVLAWALAGEKPIDVVQENLARGGNVRDSRQISALTAEGRMSALVLGILPVGMALVLYSTNPDYLGKLFEETAGWIMVGVAGGLLFTGILWLRKLIDVEL